MTPLAQRFLDLHVPGSPLLMPNAWDAGSARLLAALGFEAIATTSSGFAATLGRLDGQVSRDELLAHAAALSQAVAVPVSADAEHGFADEPEGVAETVRLAAATGLAGCSIEDWSGTALYDRELAAARVEAAAAAAHAAGIVLTARAENHIHGVTDLRDTIDRLQRYQAAGADVLFAPGVLAADDLRAVLAAIDRPLNVLVLPGCPPVPQLAELGVARVSVGGAWAYAALAAVVDAADELRGAGTFGWWDQVAAKRDAIRGALGATTAGEG